MPAKELTIQQLQNKLTTLCANGKGEEILRLQLQENEHEDVPLVDLRLVKFAGKTRIFLRFE